ncbi:MAG: TIM barrel protein [Clostridia bacterium]|nr:TIM barrel protein [Clostridia bacterium]
MIKFGPSGTDEAFAAAGYSHTVEVPSFIKENGLDIFEYSFGRGVRITKETAEKIGQAFREKEVGISVHAPYYINFAGEEPQKLRATFDYLFASLDAVKWFGGTRAVFHPGSPLKSERREAMERLLRAINLFMEEFYLNGYEDRFVCAETMGKINQLGDLDEIIEIVNVAENILPCVDFGHLNARTYGSLKSKNDYKRVLDALIDGVGEKKVKNMHVHFSKIEYGKGGEIRHLTFADQIYGPEFEPLAELLAEYRLEPWVLSESAGTQSIDAKTMKNLYFKHYDNK